MISSFRLKAGRVPGAPGESIQTTPVTIFVGPNNSGKSKVLSEINQYCMEGRAQGGFVVLDDITFRGLGPDQVEPEIEHVKSPPNEGESVGPEQIIVAGRGRNRGRVGLEDLRRVVQDPGSNPRLFCEFFLRYRTLLLDGASRMSLSNGQGGGNLRRPPETSLQVLFRDDAKRAEVRRIVKDAFGNYFVVDPTQLGHLRVCLSDHPPARDVEERALSDAAIAFYDAAQGIDSFSDGIKAFTGIITELVAGNPSVLLIDEPEAFLHPALAANLGREVSKAALSTGKRVFASTHSPTFVMGCVQSGAPVTIVRLTYRDRVATARVLPSDEILALMRHPLLRSTNVLSGLFYESVIVTEADTDRAFYHEVNERLLQFKPEWGVPNCLFVNAQNKQTVQTIVRPLRRLGIGGCDRRCRRYQGRWIGMVELSRERLRSDALACLAWADACKSEACHGIDGP
jgi:ABC-type cobalamin/Fe3+-siderophores transport system ATPase subunit